MVYQFSKQLMLNVKVLVTVFIGTDYRIIFKLILALSHSKVNHPLSVLVVQIQMLKKTCHYPNILGKLMEKFYYTIWIRKIHLPKVKISNVKNYFLFLFSVTLDGPIRSILCYMYIKLKWIAFRHTFPN